MRPGHRILNALLLPSALAAGLAWSSEAHAGPSDKAHDKPWTLNVGMGPSINLENAGAWGKLGADFQYHFKKGDVGPALGGQINTLFRENVLGMQFAPIFLWDFRIFADAKTKLYLAPVVSTGYAFVSFPGITGAGAGHAWFLTAGGQFKAVFKDWIGVYVRPLDFELWAGNGGATGYWSMVAGVTFNFG